MSDLDQRYSFFKVYKSPTTKLISQLRYHQSELCNCVPTAKKGSYRDVIIETLDGKRLYYYHQHCIMIRDGDRVTLSSCGYKTKSTLKTLGGYLDHWRINQNRGMWSLTPKLYHIEYSERKELEDKHRKEFYDGIIIMDTEIES